MTDQEKKRLTQIGVSLLDVALVPFGLSGSAQTLYSVRQTVTTFAEEAFQEKLNQFVKGTGFINSESALLFAENLGKDKESFFKRLILALDRLDIEKRAGLVGKIFTSAVEGIIEIEMFNRFVSIIEKTYYEDLTFFISDQQERVKATKALFIMPEDEEHRYSQLVAAGLLEHSTKTFGLPSPYRYKVTSIGSQFLKCFPLQ